jgi:hypothetical protein
LRIARRCRGIVRENFSGTLAVDSIGVGMAAFGHLNTGSFHSSYVGAGLYSQLYETVAAKFGSWAMSNEQWFGELLTP